MTYLKHFAAVAVAFAATNAFAVAQSFNAISATVTVDKAAVAASLGARVLSSPYSMGNGAAIKRGDGANGEVTSEPDVMAKVTVQE